LECGEKMNWANYTLIILAAITVGVSIGAHGKPRANHNFWSTFIAVIIELTLLYYGGWFK